MQNVESLWAGFSRPIATADDYIASLRGRNMNVYFMGERVAEPADHPVIRPSINAMAETQNGDRHAIRMARVRLRSRAL